MDAKMTGERIARLRKAKGLTQRELAQQLHVTDKAVSKWELGKNFPDLGLMESLAQSLDTTTAELLGLETEDREKITEAAAKLREDCVSAVLDDIKWSKRFRIFGAMAWIITCNVLVKIVGRENRGYWILLILTLICLLTWRFHKRKPS